MAFDAYLNIDGIKGESQDDKHKDWIEVLSFSWGISQTKTTPAIGAAVNARGNVQDFSVNKQVDKSSPTLMLACATGQHFKKAVLAVRKAGGTQDFLQISFQDVLLSSFAEGGHAASDQEPAPTEQISLNFAKIEMSYVADNPDGSPGTPSITDATIDNGN
jgi:type VI secretion system secreted protein Hcp